MHKLNSILKEKYENTCKAVRGEGGKAGSDAKIKFVGPNQKAQARLLLSLLISLSRLTL